MKCEWVKENVLLYVYNELPDDARYELEQHLARCADCAAELKTTRKFHAMLSELPVEEPSPNLLAASRMIKRPTIILNPTHMSTQQYGMSRWRCLYLRRRHQACP